MFLDHTHFNGIEEEYDVRIASKLYNRMYYSLIATTTIGFGDITPKSSLAKNIMGIQALFILIVPHMI